MAVGGARPHTRATEEILAGFPTLPEEDVLSVIAFVRSSKTTPLQRLGPRQKLPKGPSFQSGVIA
jgi:hypothetical protein